MQTHQKSIKYAVKFYTKVERSGKFSFAEKVKKYPQCKIENVCRIVVITLFKDRYNNHHIVIFLL